MNIRTMKWIAQPFVVAALLTGIQKCDALLISRSMLWTARAADKLASPAAIDYFHFDGGA